MVALCPVKGVSVLGEFYSALNARKNYLCRRIGLGNKVRCAESETFNLRLVVRSHNNYRQMSINGNILDLFKNFYARHTRQVKVKQNNAQSIVLFLKQAQSLLARLCDKNIVSLGKAFFEYLLIDNLVFNEQNSPFFFADSEFFNAIYHIDLCFKVALPRPYF